MPHTGFSEQILECIVWEEDPDKLCTPRVHTQCTSRALMFKGVPIVTREATSRHW